MKYVILLVACLVTVEAHADFYSGNDMHNACRKSSRDGLNSFVGAVVDKGNNDKSSLGASKEIWFIFEVDPKAREKISAQIGPAIKRMHPYCMPINVTLGQASDVFCKFLADNPAKRHFGAAALVDAAFEVTWPCGARNGLE